MEEIWKEIEGYEGLYQVSNLGRVKRDDYIKPLLDGSGKYYQVSLWKNGKEKKALIHRLVAKAFLPNPENKPCVDHIDTITTNNNVSNLRWCTHKENMNNPLTRLHNSKVNVGRRPSEETRRKMSEAQKRRWNKTPLWTRT